MENHDVEFAKRWNNRVSAGSDGRYYWLHETLLFRNPMFLFLLWKIFFFIWLGIALLVLFLVVREGNFLEVISNIGLPLLYVLAFLFVLIAFSYYVYALLMGGCYSVLFTMDEKGVTHTQLPRQFKQAQKMAVLAILAGLGSKSYGTLAAGLHAAVNQSMHSEFKKVCAVKALTRRCTIKLRSRDLMHNQIYTAPEDFDYILNYIRKRTGHARFKLSSTRREKTGKGGI